MNNPLSYSSIKLEFFSKHGLLLRPASGFIMEAGKRYYLITNRQNLASGQQESGARPYTIKTAIHIHGGADEELLPLPWGSRKKLTVCLYGDNDEPKWIERPADSYHPSIDIIALPVEMDLVSRIFSGKIRGIQKNARTGPWNIPEYRAKITAIPLSAIDTDVEYGPPDAVHIIGYPLGWSPDGTDRTSSAFWRTAFIASELYEPGMSRANTFFVDPCAPEGMTGSPVVGMKNDRLKLLGVYSDRSTAEFGANAGLVCGAWLIKELIGAT